MTIPTDDAGWKQLIRSGQPPGWGLIAAASGGGVWQQDGVFAAIVPATPDRSVFNSVFYRRGESLLEHLNEIAAAYEEAGVRAWTVWVPEEDKLVAAALEEAGHELDAEPRDMAMGLDDLRPPDPDPELEIVEREDYEDMARINEAAYGYPEGDFSVVEETKVPGFRIYFGELDGKPVSVVGVAPFRSDAIVIWVATLPEARGRGISARVLARGLEDARQAGLQTTTLQATQLGYPVYEKLGYRDYGTVQMWERRKPA